MSGNALTRFLHRHWSLRCLVKDHSPVKVEKGFICKYCGRVLNILRKRK